MNIVSDSVLVESKSARNNQLAQVSHDRATEVLNKTKALFFALWQGVGLATTEQVAEFYEISADNARQLLRSYRDEFEADGLKTLKGKALSEVRDLLSLTSTPPHLTVWTPRAALRLGMLLRDSDIAKAVRTSLLDVVEHVVLALAPPPALALASSDRLTILKEAVEIGNQLGGFDDRQKMLLKDQLMNLLIQERLLAADSTLTIEAAVAAEPEQAKRLEVPISDRCLDLGYNPNTKQLLRIGQVAAAFYRGRHGRPPQKREQFVGGTTRMVNVYTADDLSILDSAIHSVMGD
uniref:DNA-binding protein n=1 Tax=Trichocoleus desertorum TaxID=1481672 RepID=UPI0025B45E4C|nr:DNA-binding protein [Trichocoleus desertorum]